MTKSISGLAGSYMLKHRSEEHTRMYEYAQALGDRMGACDRITHRIIAEQIGTSFLISSFFQNATLFGDLRVI